MIRYTVTWDYPVRAKRGETKGPRGCLRQNITGQESDFDAAMAETKRIFDSLKGYGEHVETRFYDATAFRADPLHAKPLYALRTLA